MKLNNKKWQKHTHTHTHTHARTRGRTLERMINSQQKPLPTQRTCIHSAGLPAFPAVKLMQAYVLDRTDTGMALSFNLIGVKIPVPSAVCKERCLCRNWEDGWLFALFQLLNVVNKVCAEWEKYRFKHYACSLVVICLSNVAKTFNRMRPLK